MDSAEEADIFADNSDAMSLGDPLDVAVMEISPNRAEANEDKIERNPVKEHLLKQLNEVEERLENTKRQIQETTLLKTKILQKFSSRAFYGDSSSGSDSDLFTAGGEPIVKRKKNVLKPYIKRAKIQPLVVKSTWQHVNDDKWIIGVMLENTSDRDLYELDIHVTIKNVEEFNGMSAFWTQDSKSFWRRTNVAESGIESKVAATVVLDLPNFAKNSNAEMFGTITYESDDKTLQTLIPRVTLNVDGIMGGQYDLNFSKDTENLDPNELAQNIISMKSISIEKIVDFKMSHATKEDLADILTDNIGFHEILPKVFIARNSATQCIFEIISTSVFKYRSIIYSRSIPQLNMLLYMVYKALPKGTIVTSRNVTAKGVIQAFETELNLYSKSGNTIELQEAIVKSDLISEEFENGCTIFSKI